MSPLRHGEITVSPSLRERDRLSRRAVVRHDGHHPRRYFMSRHVTTAGRVRKPSTVSAKKLQLSTDGGIDERNFHADTKRHDEGPAIASPVKIPREEKRKKEIGLGVI